jgi:hypothetical protein
MPGTLTPTNKLTNALQTLQTTAENKRTVWGTPIPWVATPIFANGFQVAPAYGGANQLIVAGYQIPRGYSAIITGLVFGYAGGGGAALPGQVLYTVDVNNSVAAVVSPMSGYVEKDFNQVPFQLGDFQTGPVWPVEFHYDQNEFIRIKAQTVAGVAVGAGNYVFGALVGFQWPSMGWEG